MGDQEHCSSQRQVCFQPVYNTSATDLRISMLYRLIHTNFQAFSTTIIDSMPKLMQAHTFQEQDKQPLSGMNVFKVLFTTLFEYARPNCSVLSIVPIPFTSCDTDTLPVSRTLRESTQLYATWSNKPPDGLMSGYKPLSHPQHFKMKSRPVKKMFELSWSRILLAPRIRL